MRILFFGTSPFAVPSLEALLNSRHEVLGVVTQPDRPQGRGMQLGLSPVKKAALTLAPTLPLLQPEKARAKEFVQAVRTIAPDALVVAAFGQILPQRLLDIPPYGGINVHGSLLPRWRGAAPMQYALMAGDAETGVTTMQMDAGMDTGDILLQAALLLTPDDDLETVERKLSMIGAELLMETLERLEGGTCPRVPQDPELVTMSPSLPPDIGFFDWSKPARELANLMRGVTPRPGAFAFWQGKRLKVWRMRPIALHAASIDIAPGTVLDAASAAESEMFSGMGIMVKSAGATALLLEEVQPESKAKMTADAWARGARLAPGMMFDPPPNRPSAGNDRR